MLTKQQIYKSPPATVWRWVYDSFTPEQRELYEQYLIDNLIDRTRTVWRGCDEATIDQIIADTQLSSHKNSGNLQQGWVQLEALTQ